MANSKKKLREVAEEEIVEVTEESSAEEVNEEVQVEEIVKATEKEEEPEGIEFTKEESDEITHVEEALEKDDKNLTEKEKVLKSESEKAITQNAKAKSVDTLDINGVVPASKKAKKSIYKDSEIIPLGETLRFKTEAEQRKEDYMHLYNAQASKALLSGEVVAVATRSGMECAKIMYNTFTVYIPAENFITEGEKKKLAEIKNKEDRWRTLRIIMNARIGAEVDFIIEGLDETAAIAIGNRTKAMRIKAQVFYGQMDRRTGDFRIQEGTMVEARIVEVREHSMNVEYGGLEFHVMDNQIAWYYIPDVSQEFCAGETIPIIFKSVERKFSAGKLTEFHAKVSVKEAKTDPRKRYFDDFQANDIVKGVVTGINEHGVHVRIGGTYQMDLLCGYPKDIDRPGHERMKPTVGTRVLCVIKKKFEENLTEEHKLILLGQITKVLRN